MDLTPEQKKRVRCYKDLNKVDNWEPTLKALYDHWKACQLNALNMGKDKAADYFGAKADGVDDLMERIRNSLKPRKRGTKRQEHGEEEDEGG